MYMRFMLNIAYIVKVLPTVANFILFRSILTYVFGIFI